MSASELDKEDKEKDELHKGHSQDQYNNEQKAKKLCRGAETSH